MTSAKTTGMIMMAAGAIVGAGAVMASNHQTMGVNKVKKAVTSNAHEMMNKAGNSVIHMGRVMKKMY